MACLLRLARPWFYAQIIQVAPSGLERTRQLPSLCVALIKHPDNSSFKGKFRVYLASSPRLQSIIVGESRWQEIKATSHIHSQKQREKECTHA